MNKSPNNRVQRTLHKVSGPLTRDVRRERKYYEANIIDDFTVIGFHSLNIWEGNIFFRWIHLV